MTKSNPKSKRSKTNKSKWKKLTPQEKSVIVDGSTELPFTGKYNKHFKPGIYECKRCGASLYRSKDKFDSDCGWPSFDEQIPGAVEKFSDADGIRAEIRCANCGGHLGHVFRGEGYTPKNTRFCVNSISLEFIPEKKKPPKKISLKTIVLGGGCFWCTEAIFLRIKGVKKVTSGYSGGKSADANYKEISKGTTGHAEVIKLDYDPKTIDFNKLLDIFFTVHDPTQVNRQGQDVGSQYRSVIFYTTPKQKTDSIRIIKELQSKYDKPIATEVKKLVKFYEAEDYHKKYYDNNRYQPYCLLVISPKLKKVTDKFGKDIEK